MPERGDIVVFKTPQDNRTDYIKRVIGIPGDKIKIINGVININGNKIIRKKEEDFIDVRNDIFKNIYTNGCYPCSTLINISSLGGSDAIIEISATAIIPNN